MSLRTDLLLWFGLYAAIGYAGAWLARRYALQRRLLDEPGERRSHTVATPRGGGVAIVAALSIAGLALILRQPIQIVSLAAGLVGLWLVAGIGWIDDHRPLSPWLRLGCGWVG
jgi:UDP-N-acetylmuramyl pentapeptide phosphotransferase/UDP-N-acetylglucosamine-1-phosphate transferase